MESLLEQASSIYTTQMELHKLAGNRYAKVRRAARKNDNLAPEIRTKFLLLENREPVDPDWIDWAIGIPDSPYVQRLAALHPKTKAVTLKQLIKEGFAEFVAQNKSASPALLENLFRNENLHVFLAQNENLLLALQAKLSISTDWEVREILAGNPGIHAETIVRLMLDEDWDVQEALANNPRMTPNWLATLATSDWFATREAVARHPYTPPDALEQLVQDTDKDVQLAAALNANTPSSALAWCAGQDQDLRMRSAAAAHANTEQAVLDQLVKDPHPMVRQFAQARGIDTPNQELRRLAEKNNSVARVLVASHPNTDVETLQKLAKLSDPRIRGFVAANPHTSQETREALSKNSPWDVKLLLETLEQVKRSLPITLPADARLRRAIASQTATNAAWLQALAKDLDRGVQLALAASPATPVNVLEHLPNDEMVSDLISRREDIPESLGTKFEEKDVLVAADTTLATERFVRLSQKKRMPVRRQLALNPKAIQSVFNTLLDDVTIDVPRALVRNPELTSEQTRKLGLYQGNGKQSRDVQESSYLIRQHIAQTTQNIPLLLEQTRDTDFRVLTVIVNRPDCSVAVLRAVVKNQLERYRGFQRDEVNQHNLLRLVVVNPNLTADTLEMLFGIKDAQVHTSIAVHPNTNANTLTSLYNMGDPVVQNAVLHHPNAARSLLEALSFAKNNFWVGLLLFFRRFKRTRKIAQNLIEAVFAADLVRFGLMIEHPNVSSPCLKFFADITRFSRDTRFVLFRDEVRRISGKNEEVIARES